MTRLKLAELTSVVGVLVLGLGLGALLSRWVGSAADAGWAVAGRDALSTDVSVPQATDCRRRRKR